MNFLYRLFLTDKIRSDLPAGYLFIDAVDYRLQCVKRKLHYIYGGMDKTFLKIENKQNESVSIRSARFPLRIKEKNERSN